jgi:hypothetical protein
MTDSEKVPFDVLRLIQSRQARAKDDLDRAMFSYWHQLGGLTPEQRQPAGRQQVIQLLGFYASKIFDLEAQEYVGLKLKAPELIRALEELAARMMGHLIPPQFTINSPFYLGDLHYHDAYRSHIMSVVEDRKRYWTKGRVGEKKVSGSARAILNGYCKRERLTIRQFAREVRVDPSVIYALKAGRKRCGPDTLARIADLVGCEPGQLLDE